MIGQCLLHCRSPQLASIGLGELSRLDMFRLRFPEFDPNRSLAGSKSCAAASSDVMLANPLYCHSGQSRGSGCNSVSSIAVRKRGARDADLRSRPCKSGSPWCPLSPNVGRGEMMWEVGCLDDTPDRMLQLSAAIRTATLADGPCC